MARRIEDYVRTLSREERERFRDLIEECRARERSIQVSAENSQAALVRLAEQQGRLHEALAELEQVGTRLRDSVLKLYLTATPRTGAVH